VGGAAKHGTVSIKKVLGKESAREKVLADFGFTLADFAAMADEPESSPTGNLNGEAPALDPGGLSRYTRH
jgi:hypothetical protein